MKILRKPKRRVALDPQALIVPSIAGDQLQVFPVEVIESLRQLINRLQKGKGLPKRLSLVSALRREGVSYLSQALSATISHDLGLRVCLVELNYWWPHPLFRSVEKTRSLAAVVQGEITITNAIFHTGWPNFSILPAGVIPRQNRPKVANSESLRDVIEELSKVYDLLILDVPAILATTDSVTLATLGTAACLVVQQGMTHVEDVRQALDEIEHMDIVGVVMNRAHISTPPILAKMLSF